MPLRAQSEEFQPIDRYTDEMMGLLEACSDKLLHAAAWHLIAVYSADLAEAAPPGSERSRAPAPPVKRRGWVPNSAS